MKVMDLFKEFRQVYPQWKHLSIPDRTHESVNADWVEFLEEKLTSDNSEYLQLLKRFKSGRDYLMQVQAEEVTVEDCLVAFGWDSNGFE